MQLLFDDRRHSRHFAPFARSQEITEGSRREMKISDIS